MNTTWTPSARILASTGLALAVVSVFLFLGLRDPAERSETFAFTVTFVVFQELAFFGALAMAGRGPGAGASSLVVPHRATVVSGIAAYNAVALVTVVVFNLLLPGHSSPRTYYTVTLAETGFAGAAVILLQLVDVTARRGHAVSEVRHRTVEDLRALCRRAHIALAPRDAALAQHLSDLEDRIRFSEAVRSDPHLAERVNGLLEQIETIAHFRDDTEATAETLRLLEQVRIQVMR